VVEAKVNVEDDRESSISLLDIYTEERVDERESSVKSHKGVLMRCHCGVTGLPRELYLISPPEGDVLKCYDCKTLSHVACQPDGRYPSVKWKCQACSLLERKEPVKEVTHHW
jgi:hypothetical protein